MVAAGAAAAAAACCCQLPHLDRVYVINLCPHVQHAHFVTGYTSSRRCPAS